MSRVVDSVLARAERTMQVLGDERAKRLVRVRMAQQEGDHFADELVQVLCLLLETMHERLIECLVEFAVRPLVVSVDLPADETIEIGQMSFDTRSATLVAEEVEEGGDQLCWKFAQINCHHTVALHHLEDGNTV